MCISVDGYVPVSVGRIKRVMGEGRSFVRSCMLYGTYHLSAIHRDAPVPALEHAQQALMRTSLITPFTNIHPICTTPRHLHLHTSPRSPRYLDPIEILCIQLVHIQPHVILRRRPPPLVPFGLFVKLLPPQITGCDAIIEPQLMQQAVDIGLHGEVFVDVADDFEGFGFGVEVH